MISEEDKLEFEALPEFVREPKPAREAYTAKTSASGPKAGTAAAIASSAVAAAGTAAAVAGTAAAVAGTAAAAVANKLAAAAAPKPAPVKREEPISTAAKHAELEALWPGVGHDVFHSMSKKSGAGYFGTGFVAGIIATVIVGGAGQWATHMMSSTQPSKEIVVAQAGTKGRSDSGVVRNGEPGAIIPLVPVYQVASGDTLAGIALKNYHRATPRLLDEICKANNMTNANVLSLGQKLKLPDYHPQSRQIATGVNQIQQ